jgi:membrane associated rhomboid family serine protease
MFLHTSFVHIFWNVLSFFMIGFSIEHSIANWKRYIGLLVLGAIGGNLFSAVVDPYSFGVGASTSLFAVLGCLCTWFYINFDKLGPLKYQYLMFFVIMMAFALMNGFISPGSGVDAWGHMGGFIVGLCLSVLILRATDASDQRK